MAALHSTDARVSSPVDRFRLLRELGPRGASPWAALESLPNGKTDLVVVERLLRDGSYGDAEIAQWVRDARCLASLDHPNVARVRDAAIREKDVVVVSDFIDGVRWSELVLCSPRPSIELAVRVLVDVLSGLSAIHNLRDAKRQPLKLVHGELAPDRVLIGLDGVARLLKSCRVRRAGVPTEKTPIGYLAPEVLLADDAADARSDVYSVGVMLWEALSGRELFPNAKQASAVVTQILSGGVPAATVSEAAAWAKPLAEAAAKALSSEPNRRFGSAAVFAAELRRVAGARLAPAARAAGLVRANFGDRIRTRRDALERGDTNRSIAPDEIVELESESDPPLSGRATVSIPIEFDERSPTAPPPPPVTPSKPAAAAAGAAPLAALAPAAAPVPAAPPPIEPAVSAIATSTPTAPFAPRGRVLAAAKPPPMAPTGSLTPSPPTWVVPAAPAVPRDLAASLENARTRERSVPRASDRPAAPASTGSDGSSERAAPVLSRRWLAVLPIVATALVAVIVAWWLLARTPAPPAARSAAAGHAAAAREVAAPTGAVPAVVASAVAPPVAPPVPEPAETPPKEEPTRPASASPPALPSRPSPVAGPARPASKRKYEPEGI